MSTPPTPPAGISYGYGQLQPATNRPVDLTGVGYDPRQQISLIGGRPAVDLPSMATTLATETVEDGQRIPDVTKD